MARKHHKPEEIVAKLRQVEVLLAQGKSAVEAVRTIGVTEQTYYRWRSEYGGLKLDQVKRLKVLEQENGRLRRAVADLTLEKLVLKEAFRGRLPNDILFRPKQGFVTPVSAWLRGPLAGQARAIAAGASLNQLGWFDARTIAKFADDHIAGKSDHGRLLWQLLMLDRSLRNLGVA